MPTITPGDIGVVNLAGEKETVGHITHHSPSTMPTVAAPAPSAAWPLTPPPWQPGMPRVIPTLGLAPPPQSACEVVSRSAAPPADTGLVLSSRGSARQTGLFRHAKRKEWKEKKVTYPESAAVHPAGPDSPLPSTHWVSPPP